ncbi:MAG: hypothetical protein Q8879_01275, partial [Candidatus Phytoplasma australasiaticum]|nr:hypothetical protein [Candidatus Phytoplasma australasiaticum]
MLNYTNGNEEELIITLSTMMVWEVKPKFYNVRLMPTFFFMPLVFIYTPTSQVTYSRVSLQLINLINYLISHYYIIIIE